MLRKEKIQDPLKPVCVCVSQEAACAYVIALMAVYWCTEVLPLAVTALLPTILFPILSIMKSKDVRPHTHTHTVNQFESINN